MEVFINGGTPKSSIFMGVSLINHPAMGYPHDYGNPHPTHRVKKKIAEVDARSLRRPPGESWRSPYCYRKKWLSSLINPGISFGTGS